MFLITSSIASGFPCPCYFEGQPFVDSSQHGDQNSRPVFADRFPHKLVGFNEAAILSAFSLSRGGSEYEKMSMWCRAVFLADIQTGLRFVDALVAIPGKAGAD